MLILRMKNDFDGFSAHLFQNCAFKVSQSKLMADDFVKTNSPAVYQIYRPQMRIRIDDRSHDGQFLAVDIKQRNSETL